MESRQRLSYVWDYDIDRAQFQEILEGRRALGRLDQDWAAQRLLEYAPYEEIIRLIGFRKLVESWPRWRGKIRSKSRVRGLDFLVSWLPEKHPELLAENILANKVTALLSREEPKDLAYIWGFCCQKGLSLQAAITDAKSKAAGVFPADLSRVLISAKLTDWESVRWIQAPPVENFITQLNQLGESLLLLG